MSEEANVTVNREYKDRLFNFIFGREENREWTLSLYNAVNGSNHTDPSGIEFNTLEDVLYLGMRNDTSFLISDIMSVYEAQSTFNPNLPLRLLGYVDELYSGYISRNKLNKYGSKLISLPIPKLVVFYNGQTDKMDETIIKLSDSFNESHRAEADIEVKVRMLNVNHGRNCELMEKCKPLAEYAWFVSEIRDYRKSFGIETSVRLAIEAMPDDFVIKIFLVGHMKEVEGMLDREYKEEEVKELFKREGREEGKEETIVTQICKKLVKGKSVSEIADAIEEPEEYVSKVCEIASKYLPNYDVYVIMSEL
ncbi:MAG: hypothetical protein K6G63_02330 [Eubacterium sp.]|nr:hypothetical protein [Eubacterium sp.]